ncbi:acyl carrier protein, partial [bacterium LRH843]|nr:acyl carrier protein [bacterium LRH843]
GNIMDNVDISSLPESKQIAAKCLVKTVASVIGAALRSRISLESNFYSLGGNSLNSVYTVTRLRDQGFTIAITEFVSSENLPQIIDR